MSSPSYSEDDIRRAADIREWLIKQISDRQEEVERLRTTLSIIDNLLKQGSFKAAANLGFAESATAAETPTTAGMAATSTQIQQQQQPHQSASPRQLPPTSRQQRAATPTLKATTGDDDDDTNSIRRDNIRPLKRARDDFLLANAEVSPGAVVIMPAPGVNININTPPFKSFFLNRILEGMKSKDAEKMNQGALSESDALNYKVEEDNGGMIKRIVINNYREKERLQEIFNTSAWVFTRMLEKTGS
ncbi:MAG: hypothetical protein M3258_00420 [Thermoproteota archaeon]|jgi:hypothetical protein|nr:hypothetical protein [Thermoproteota archaeon]